MKYLVEYEDLDNVSDDGPDIGDYVICTSENYLGIDPRIENFLADNIGQIIEINNNPHYPYKIQYDIIFDKNGLSLDSRYHFNRVYFQFNSDPDGCRIFNRRQILVYSRNKEDLEIKLNQRKYNL